MLFSILLTHDQFKLRHCISRSALLCDKVFHRLDTAPSQTIRRYDFHHLVVIPEAEAERRTETVANLDLWSLIEPCSSTICICLPCLGPLFRGGHSPSSLVNSVRAIFSLRSDSSSQDHVNGDQPSNTQDRVKLNTLQAVERLSQDDSQWQDDIHDRKVGQISDLEGRGARVECNG